jgi:RNA polymerase sigma-70 factor (ECF subfamily)
MKELLDNKTLVAFVQGEQDGFRGVFNAYYTEIRYFTWKFTSNREEAEDITIETFYKLFQLHDRFTTNSNIRAFLYITARNNCLNYLKSTTRKRRYNTDFSDIPEDQITADIPDTFSQHAILETKLVKEVYEAIQELPEKSRLILKMIYFEGLSVNNIAQQLCISNETVRSQKRYALHLLRLRFSESQLMIAFICSLAFVESTSFLDPAQLFV